MISQPQFYCKYIVNCRFYLFLNDTLHQIWHLRNISKCDITHQACHVIFEYKLQILSKKFVWHKLQSTVQNSFLFYALFHLKRSVLQCVENMRLYSCLYCDIDIYAKYIYLYCFITIFFFNVSLYHLSF